MVLVGAVIVRVVVSPVTAGGRYFYYRAEPGLASADHRLSDNKEMDRPRVL